MFINVNCVILSEISGKKINLDKLECEANEDLFVSEFKRLYKNLGSNELESFEELIKISGSKEVWEVTAEFFSLQTNSTFFKIIYALLIFNYNYEAGNQKVDVVVLAEQLFRESLPLLLSDEMIVLREEMNNYCDSIIPWSIHNYITCCEELNKLPIEKRFLEIALKHIEQYSRINSDWVGWCQHVEFQLQNL